MNKKIKNRKVAEILSHIKNLKENMMNLNLLSEDSFCESLSTRPTQQVQNSKSKGKLQKVDKSGRNNIKVDTIPDEDQN